MKNILIVSYHFPPLGGAGVQRTLKFVKYLPEFNYNPIVVTPNPSFLRYHSYDPTLLDELPKSVQIYKTFIFDLNWLFKLLYGLKLSKLVSIINGKLFFPDYHKQWFPFAKRKIKKILEKEHIDLVYMTSPPHSIQELGAWIKKKYKLPVITDFRDPLTFNHKEKSSVLFDKCFSYEKELLENSDFIIANTNKNKKTYVNKFNIAESKVEVITNGFDKDDFNGILKEKNKKANDKIIFSHVGKFYGEYNAEPLIYALSKIRDKLLNVEFRFIGSVTKTDKALIEKFELTKLIKLIDYTTHKKALNYSQDSDYMLIILPNERWSYCIPGKTFEYINSNRKIVAIVPENGSCAEVILNTETGIVISPEKTNTIGEVILGLINNTLEINFKPSKDEIDKFERKNLTKKLVSIFDSLYD